MSRHVLLKSSNLPVLPVRCARLRFLQNTNCSNLPTIANMSTSRRGRRPNYIYSTQRPMLNNPKTDMAELKETLKGANRILALCGAGLSAASGLPTFRGAGGLWRNHKSTSLATPAAFEANPSLVWLFYAWRRHMALNAKPNKAHYALAELAAYKANFLCLTQNVDGLSPRAGHPASALRCLHGNLLDVKCSNESCDYLEPNNLKDPLCPALAPAAEDYPPDETMPLLDPNVPPPQIKPEDLPQCPQCKSLLRPGVVWFGEALPEGMLEEVDAWVRRGNIDVMLVVGTAATVHPACDYIWEARNRGAVVAVVNPDPLASDGLDRDDFFFMGDAADVLPELFEGVIGKLEIPGEEVETSGPSGVS